MKEVSLSVPSKGPSVRSKFNDTIDSITYHQTQDDNQWNPIFKAKNLPTDVFHIVGVTTYKNLRFRCTDYFYLQSWNELLELNKAFRDCGLWYYDKKFLRSAKRLLEDLSYSFDWCSPSIYFPKTLRPLVISPDSAFNDTKTTPVILVSARLQALDKVTRDALKELEINP